MPEDDSDASSSSSLISSLSLSSSAAAAPGRPRRRRLTAPAPPRRPSLLATQSSSESESNTSCTPIKPEPHRDHHNIPEQRRSGQLYGFRQQASQQGRLTVASALSPSDEGKGSRRHCTRCADARAGRRPAPPTPPAGGLTACTSSCFRRVWGFPVAESCVELRC